MSAKNRGAVVRANGVYPTPENTIISMLDELDADKACGLIWGEPCVNDWAIPNMFDTHLGYGSLFGEESGRWKWAELSKGRDYLIDGMTGNVDGIITNPDFAIAQEFITKSLKDAPFVAYLLRLNFFGSRKRKEWWQGKEPTHLFTLAERPSFVDVCKGSKKDGIKPCGASYLKKDVIKVCSCGGKVSAGTDATEYAWFVWDRLGLCKRPPGMYVI